MFLYSASLKFNPNKTGILVSEHAKSLRLKPGDEVDLNDFNGRRIKVKILAYKKEKGGFAYQTLESKLTNCLVQTTLYQAIPDKLYIEKMCEVAPIAGISKIVLFASQRSAKFEPKIDRWNKILIRSCEQTEADCKPEIEVYSWPKFLQEIETKPENVALLHKAESKELNENKLTFENIICGPEGGFTPDELETFGKLGLKNVTLGEHVLPAWLAGFTYFINKKI